MTAFQPEQSTPINVTVDTEDMQRLLRPILEEINSLRARVAALEKFPYVDGDE